MAFPEDGGRERIELVEAFNCCKACWTASSSLAKPHTHVSRVDKRLIEFLLATCSQLHVFLAWDHCTAFISLLSCPFLHCFHH